MPKYDQQLVKDLGGAGYSVRSEDIVFVGKMVHYIIPLGPSQGERRPAIVTRIEGEGVDLSVFTSLRDGGLTDGEGWCARTMDIVRETGVLRGLHPGHWCELWAVTPAPPPKEEAMARG